MSKKVLIILADGFEEIEAITPIDVLRRAGLDVKIAGVGKTVIESARGLKVTVDLRIEDYKESPDAVVLPGGGGGAENLSKSAAVTALLKKMDAAKKSIAAICASPSVVLSPLGILNGRRATGYPGMENLMSPQVKVTAERVVTDGHVTTSLGPGSSMEFSLELVRRLCGEAKVQELIKQMVVKI